MLHETEVEAICRAGASFSSYCERVYSIGLWSLLLVRGVRSRLWKADVAKKIFG